MDKTTEFDNTSQSVWSTKLPGLQLGWDPTSVRAWMTCPRSYYYGIVRGLRLTNAGDLHLKFGKWWHGMTEVYAKLRWKGATKDDALEAAVGWGLANSGTRTSEGKWVAWESGDNNKSRWTLVRAFAWVVDEQDPAQLEVVTLPNGEPAVELSLDIPIQAHASTGEQLRMSARIDSIRTVGPAADLDSECWAVEEKTTKSTVDNRFFDKFSPDPQTDQYDAMVGILMEDIGRPVKGVVVNALQAAVEFNRAQRQFLHRSKSQRMEAVQRVIQAARQADKAAAAANVMMAPEEAYEMRVTSCHQMGRCPFLKICGRRPEVRQDVVRSDYTARGPWEPFKRDERPED